MKQRMMAFLAALFCLATGYAGNLRVDDVSLRPGETKDLKISLASAGKAVGLQFDVKLPDGCSLAKTNDKVYQLSSNQPSDMTCNVSDLGDNTFRFILYSSALQNLKTGELINLNLKVRNNVPLGNYPILFSNVTFSDIDGNISKETDVEAAVKVTNFYPDAQNMKVEDVTIRSKEIASISISLLESISGCVGIQFDLHLPDGLSLEKGSNDKEYEISTNQANDVLCNLTPVGTNSYRFMLYSNSLREFISGDLMAIHVKVKSENPLASYTLSIKDVLLSDIGGNVHKDSGADAKLIVKKFLLGDANQDGAVNVTDIVATVNYIMENPTGNFDFEAADVNEDGSVNVTDIVGMVNIIMSSGSRMDQQQVMSILKEYGFIFKGEK